MNRLLWLAALFTFIAGESFAQTLGNSQELGVLNFNQYYNGSNVVARTTGYSGMIYTDLTSGNFVLETGGTNTAGATVTRTPLVTVTAIGALGIGTSTPRASVDLGYKTDALILQSGTTGQRPTAVEGMIRYNSTTSKVEAYQGGSWETFGGTTTAGSTMYLGTSTAATSPSRSDDVTTGLFSDTATTVALSVGGVEALRVTATGVGVGTTSPSSALHVVASGTKTSNYSGVLLVNSATSSSTGIIKSALELQSFGSWGILGSKSIGLYISTVTGGTYSYDAIFNGGGNVGIATTSPTEKLGIAGNIGFIYGATRRIYVVGSTSSAGTNLSIEGGAAYVGAMGASGGNVLIDSGTPAAAGTAGNILLGSQRGNVGIATATPYATLDVNGYMKLAKRGSPPAAPVACSSTYEGSIAYTGGTTKYLCFCDGTNWVQAHSPSTACTW